MIWTTYYHHCKPNMNFPPQNPSKHYPFFSLTVNKHYIISDPSTRRSLVFWLKVVWFPFCQNDSVRLFVFFLICANSDCTSHKNLKSKNQVWDEKLGLLRKSGCHTYTRTHSHKHTHTHKTTIKYMVPQIHANLV